MKRLELIGPPGAGKTTCKGALLAAGRAGTMFCWDQDSMAALAGLPDWMACRAQAWLFRNRRSLLARAVFRLGDARAVKPTFLRDFPRAERWEAVVDFYMRTLAVLDASADRRLVAHHLFLRSVSAAAYAEAHARAGVVVFDEGLAQRGFTLAYSGAPLAVVEQYFALCPLPDALGVLQAPAEILSRRLAARAGSGEFTDDGASALAAEVSALCARVFAARGCAVEVLDSTVSPAVGAGALLSRLHG